MCCKVGQCCCLKQIKYSAIDSQAENLDGGSVKVRQTITNLAIIRCVHPFIDQLERNATCHWNILIIAPSTKWCLNWGGTSIRMNLNIVVSLPWLRPQDTPSFSTLLAFQRCSLFLCNLENAGSGLR